MEPKQASSPDEMPGSNLRCSLTMDDTGCRISEKPHSAHTREQSQMLDCEKDFMEFLLTLPAELPETSTSLERTRRHSRVPKAKPKVGLDHLDNLCKLMEQLGDLKDQNQKLQRRVQYLEDMKDLHDMHRLLEPDGALEGSRASPRTPSPGAYGGALSAEESSLHKSRTQVTLRSSNCRRRSRERSKSVGTQDDYTDTKSVKNSRFPNWSRVKEALGLERLAVEYEGTPKDGLTRPTTSDGGSYQSEGRTIPTTDGRRAAWDAGDPDLPSQSFSWSEGSFHASMQADSFRQASMSHATLRPGESVRRKSSPISATTTEDGARMTAFDPKRNCNLDSDPLYADMGDSYGSEELCKKVPKSAWGRVKNLIQTGRETVKRQPRTAKCAPSQAQFKVDHRTDSDVPSYGAPSDPEDSSTSRGRDYLRRRKISDQLGSSSRNSRTSDDLQLLPKERSKSQNYIQSTPHHLDVECDANRKSKIQQQISCPSAHETSKLTLSASERSNAPSPQSPQSQRKSRWNRVKKVFSASPQEKKDEEPPGASNPSSPVSTAAVFDFDDLAAYEGARACDDASEAPPSAAASLCHSATAPMTSLVQELQRNLSDDFNQKILEWERMKAAKSGRSPRPVRKFSAPHRSAAAAKVARDKTKPPRNDKKKELTWVNRELQKMEREKERLSRETHKFQERSVRLHRLRQALLNAPASSNEVLVRTSAGEFRFEGISNAFTKKLYEWETKKGVVPEFSTIALLDASLQTCRNGEKAVPGNLRGLSRSESSIAEPCNALHSRASTSSLPSMKPDALVVPEEKKEVSRSRANSEPDLCSSGGKGDCAVTRPRTVSVGSAETGFAHPEVTWLIDSGSGEVCNEFKAQPCQDPTEAKPTEDSYYNLLEENMLLLEQLRAKENVCARLEANLERLDERLELMAARHREEIERYRESLWNAHRPAGTQRSSLASMKAVADFRYRLEDLERCNFRLQEERRTLQETIRSQSEEQAALIWDIVEKVKQLQSANTDLQNEETEGDRRRTSLMQLDADGLARIQQLSEQLLQSAQLLEAAVADRSSQVCQLRRELLMSELSSAGRCAANPARSLRALRSASDGLLGVARNLHADANRSGLRTSVTSPVVERGPGPSVQLMNTVHKLRSELLRLFASHGVAHTLGDTQSEGTAHQDSSTHEAVASVSDAADLSRRPNGFRENARHSLASSSESPSRRSAPEALASGHDGSESSSINDSEHMALGLRLPRSGWSRTRDTLSTSSDSSCLEDDSFTRMALGGGGAIRRLAESHDWRRFERDHELGRRVSCYGDYEDDVFNDPSSASSLEVTCTLARKNREAHDLSGAFKDAPNSAEAQGHLRRESALQRVQQKARSDSPTRCNALHDASEFLGKAGHSARSPHRISFSESENDPPFGGFEDAGDPSERNSSSVSKAKASRRFKKERFPMAREHNLSDSWTYQKPTAADTQNRHMSTRSTSPSRERYPRNVLVESTVASSTTGQSPRYIPRTSYAPSSLQSQGAKEPASYKETFTALLAVPDGPLGSSDDTAAVSDDAALEEHEKPESALQIEDQTTRDRKCRQEPAEKSFLSLRLRRPKRKDYSAIGQLCRQTLPVSVPVENACPPDPLAPALARSLSSPVTARSRTFSRSKWLPLFATKS